MAFHGVQGFQSQSVSEAKLEPQAFLPQSVIELHLLLGAEESCTQVGDLLPIPLNLAVLAVCVW